MSRGGSSGGFVPRPRGLTATACTGHSGKSRNDWGWVAPGRPPLTGLEPAEGSLRSGQMPSLQVGGAGSLGQETVSYNSGSAQVLSACSAGALFTRASTL